MTGEERRSRIMETLQGSKDPVSGAELAKRYGVSRQVIVQDIALLRAVNRNIVSTTTGYMLYENKPHKGNRCFSVLHSDVAIEDELCTIVDHGGTVLDVIVLHEIYGEIAVNLVIKNRKDVSDFVEKLKASKTAPLKELTGGIHIHTVEADSEAILNNIEKKLREKGYLVEDNQT